MTVKRARGITTSILVAAVCCTALPADASSYKIKPGDTLWELAAKHHTTPKAIAKANGISENATLALGRSIVIPGKAATAKKNASKWASAKHAKPSAAAKVSKVVHTRVASACLRTGPSTGTQRKAVLQTGTTAKVLGTSGKWAKIALPDGTCGYVYRSLLAPGVGSTTARAVPVAKPVQVASNPASSHPELIRTALACRGASYRRGGTSRGGFDCSGFTRYVYSKYGVSLPHSSAAQAHLGTPVAKSELRAGDLVFFQTYRRGISHVGIFVGGNNFVHAATYGRGVRVDSLASGYYASRYRGARRVKQ